MLNEHYTDAGRVRQLLALGSLSSLRALPGAQHDFQDDLLARQQGWTTAYRRDRGDRWEDVAPLGFLSRRQFEARLLEFSFIEWAYLFQDGCWWVAYLPSYHGKLPKRGIRWEPLAMRLSSATGGQS